MCTELRRDPRDLRVAGRLRQLLARQARVIRDAGRRGSDRLVDGRSLARSVIFSAFATSISFAVIGRTDDAEKPNDP